MLERVSQVAERVATVVSRRGFLGKLAQGALAVAGALGAFLASGREAQAVPQWVKCCVYNNGSVFCYRQGCPKYITDDRDGGFGTIYLVRSQKCNSCGNCPFCLA